jgi:hypothetical protein
MKRATSSRTTREDILKGIGYEPLTFPASLHVPEALRAEEDRAMQDYKVARTPGLWDFIHAHENDPDPNAKLTQDSMQASTREMSVAALPIPQESSPLLPQTGVFRANMQWASRRSTPSGCRELFLDSAFPGHQDQLPRRRHGPKAALRFE